MMKTQEEYDKAFQDLVDARYAQLLAEKQSNQALLCLAPEVGDIEVTAIAELDDPVSEIVETSPSEDQPIHIKLNYEEMAEAYGLEGAEGVREYLCANKYAVTDEHADTIFNHVFLPEHQRRNASTV